MGGGFFNFLCKATNLILQMLPKHNFQKWFLVLPLCTPRCCKAREIENRILQGFHNKIPLCIISKPNICNVCILYKGILVFVGGLPLMHIHINVAWYDIEVNFCKCPEIKCANMIFHFVIVGAEMGEDGCGDKHIQIHILVGAPQLCRLQGGH